MGASRSECTELAHLIYYPPHSATIWYRASNPQKEYTMQNVIDTILADREMLSYLRMYMWDGFAQHNIMDLYTNKYGDPTNGATGLALDRFWKTVRDSVYPVVRQLYDKHGEFRTIVWE